MCDFNEWPPIGGKKLSKQQPTVVPLSMLTIDDEIENPAVVKRLAEIMQKSGFPDDDIYPEVKWNGKSFTVVLGKSRIAAARLAGLTEIPVFPNRAVLSVAK